MWRCRATREPTCPRPQITAARDRMGHCRYQMRILHDDTRLHRHWLVMSRGSSDAVAALPGDHNC
jgi:hypothetical protein